MKESWEKPEVSFQHLLHLQKDLHAWNPGCSSKLDQQVCVRKGYSPTVPNSLSLFPFTSRAVERYYCVCQRLLLTMQTLGCSPFLNAQDLFFFCQRIPFLKYNFLIQDRGWKILWEGGSSLIFLFLPIIQICIIYCMLYLDCRTTCWFQWSLAEVIWEPQKYRWLFFFSFFFFPSSTVSCQWVQFSWTHFQAARLNQRCVGTQWPLKLPTAQFRSFNILMSPCSWAWDCAAPGPSHHPTLITVQDMWTGWEDECTPLHLTNVLKLINNTMMGAGVPHLDPSGRLWDSRNSGIFLVDLGTCIQVTRSHLLPLQKEPEIQGDPRTSTGNMIQRALAQESCERMQQREREKEGRKSAVCSSLD